MASVILKSVGAAVGNFLLPGFGGALLGSLGAGLGSLVDSKLGLGATVTGPRLENLSVQDSRYGAGIPIVYGNARVAGNVIWATDLIEAQHTETAGGKGGALSPGVTTRTYTYSVHCAIGICAGPIAGLATIWADNTIIYQDGVWTPGLFDAVQIYAGHDDQVPDSFMQSLLGAGEVPAYRGLAYLVFDNLQLASFGNRLPNLTFEIMPVPGAAKPLWLGSVDAHISARESGFSSGLLMPIVLQKSGTTVRRVLLGGFERQGNTARFVVAAYDVFDEAPVERSRSVSAEFPAAAPPADLSWALSPDGRFVAFYAQKSSAPSHAFALYDTETETFGELCGIALSTATPNKQIAWLDALHVVIGDIFGNVRGVRIFARAGLALVDLGFTGLWGSGSASSTSLFYGAQFTPCAEGLLAYVLTDAHSLQARRIFWRGAALSMGGVFSIATLPLGTESGKHARFIQTGNEEWTLAYGNMLNFALMSFAPSADSATVTRSWQSFTPGTGINTTFFPVFHGDRLIIVQNPIFSGAYLLSEILLGEGGFTQTPFLEEVTGAPNTAESFCALKLDPARLLFAGLYGTAYNIGQLAIIARHASGSLAAILADILTRAGYEAADYDVSALADSPLRGYVLQDVLSARSAIEPLQYYKPFDLIETEGRLKAVLRGGPGVAALPSSEACAAFDGEASPPPFLVLRAEEMDLPREVTIDVIDPARNFEINTQRARRGASSARMVHKAALPVVCTAGTAKQIAETKLYTAWAERDLVKLTVSRTWMALEPSDVVALDNGQKLRIAAVRQSAGLLQLEGFYGHAESLKSAATADSGQGIGEPGGPPAPCTLYLLDLPLLQAADNQPGVYIAASAAHNWKGASIYRSGDGISFAPFASAALAATSGLATTALEDGPSLYPDRAHAAFVQLASGTLSSCTPAELLNGANAALLGDEIIQFRQAELIGPGHYRLSHLLRGRRGTETHAATHVPGERFVLLKAGTLSFIPGVLGDRDKTFVFRALAPGQTLGSAEDYGLTYGMKTLCPLAPVHIKAVRSLGTGGDLTLSWTRRARLNAEWNDHIDVPLDEDEELYRIDIMDGAVVKRTLSAAAASVVYPTAQQTEDWGAGAPFPLAVRIAQVSARYGNGAAALAAV